MIILQPRESRLTVVRKEYGHTVSMTTNTQWLTTFCTNSSLSLPEPGYDVLSAMNASAQSVLDDGMLEASRHHERTDMQTLLLPATPSSAVPRRRLHGWRMGVAISPLVAITVLLMNSAFAIPPALKWSNV